MKNFINKNSKIYISGHNGMVGSALKRCFKLNGYTNLIGKSSSQLDLRSQIDVDSFFAKEKPDAVILAAAKVGGIMANISAPAEFIYDNMMIESNIIHSSYKYNVKKLLFLASSCIYPRVCLQPMKEEYLLDGKFEPTNEGYAIAKIAGLKMCEMYNKQYGTTFISVIPCNLYGIEDNFDTHNSHVIPALIRNFHEAKMESKPQVIVWGTGNARREFLYTEDLAEACLYLFENYSGEEFFNIGTGMDISIKELASLIKHIVGYKGEIVFDATKPDGMPQKLLDVSKLTYNGWKYHTNLEDGLRLTYRWYKDTINKS